MTSLDDAGRRFPRAAQPGFDALTEENLSDLMDSSANTISLICLILLVEIIQTSLQFSNKSKAVLLPYSGGASFWVLVFANRGWCQRFSGLDEAFSCFASVQVMHCRLCGRSRENLSPSFQGSTRGYVL